MATRNTLTQKQENFANLLYQGLTQRKAWGGAGFSTKYSVERIDSNACTLANTMKIKYRLEELRQAVKSQLIIDQTRRKEILTEIALGDLTDYTSCGPDRDIINVGPESKNTKALQEVTSHTEYDGDGAKPAVVTKIKLKDSVKAIDLLNKMDGLYDDKVGGNTVNIIAEKVFIDARGKLEDALNRLATRAGA